MHQLRVSPPASLLVFLSVLSWTIFFTQGASASPSAFPSPQPSPCVPGTATAFLNFTKKTDISAPEGGQTYDAKLTDRSGKQLSKELFVTVLSSTQTILTPDGGSETIPAPTPALSHVIQALGRVAGYFFFPPDPATNAPLCGLTIVLRAETDPLCSGYSPVTKVLTAELTYTTPACDTIPSPTPSPSPSPLSLPPHLAQFNTFLGVTATTVALISTLLTLLNTVPGLFGQLPGFFAAVFSARKQTDRWWLVIDTHLGKPVVGAVVQVFDSAMVKLQDQQVTGNDGQCGFLLPPGTYTVNVRRPGFVFPAKERPPISLKKGEILYTGGHIEILPEHVEKPEKAPHLIMPMAPQQAASAANIAFRRTVVRVIAFLDAVSLPLLILGASLNTLFVLYSPHWLNITFEILYGVLIALKILLWLFRKNSTGSVKDAATDMPISLSTIRLYEASTNRLLQTRVTGQDGRFFFLLSRGRYSLAIAKEGYETVNLRNVEIVGRRSKTVSLHVRLRKMNTAASPGSAAPRPTPAPPAPAGNQPSSASGPARNAPADISEVAAGAGGPPSHPSSPVAPPSPAPNRPTSPSPPAPMPKPVVPGSGS